MGDCPSGLEADFNDASNFLDIFRTRSPNNDEDYSNPSFDELLEDAASTSESMRRRLLLEESERTMLATTQLSLCTFMYPSGL